MFRCLCAGAEHGRLAEIEDRGDLWRVLVTMTLRKTIDQQRRLAGKKRGSGKVRGESVFMRKSGEEASPGLQQFSGDIPTPQMMVIIEEEGQRLLDALGRREAPADRTLETGGVHERRDRCQAQSDDSKYRAEITADPREMVAGSGSMTSDRQNEAPAPDPESEATLIDRICDDFENAWRQGRCRASTTTLAPCAEPLRSRLFEELLLSELEARFEWRDYGRHRHLSELSFPTVHRRFARCITQFWKDAASDHKLHQPKRARSSPGLANRSRDELVGQEYGSYRVAARSGSRRHGDRLQGLRL